MSYNPAAAKAEYHIAVLAARLKSCPDTKLAYEQGPCTDAGSTLIFIFAIKPAKWMGHGACIDGPDQ
jgi:hypothetical protein